MPTNDEWRRILGSDLSDEELEEFLRQLRSFIGSVLADYFKDDFDADHC